MEFANRLQNVEIPALRTRFGFELPGLALPCDGTGVGRRRREARYGFVDGKVAGMAMHARIVVSGSQQAR